MKSSSKKLKELLKKLSEDKVLRSAIEDFKASADGDKAYTARSITDFLTYILKMSVGFLGKRKAKAYVEIVEIVGFLISLSIFLKKNLFDRPEVKQFFRDSWTSAGDLAVEIMNSAREYVNKMLTYLKRGKNQGAA